MFTLCMFSCFKEDSQDIENELEVMQEIYEMYDEISKIPADEQLIQRFKESFSEDMQVEKVFNANVSVYVNKL